MRQDKGKTSDGDVDSQDVEKGPSISAKNTAAGARHGLKQRVRKFNKGTISWEGCRGRWTCT